MKLIINENELSNNSIADYAKRKFMIEVRGNYYLYIKIKEYNGFMIYQEFARKDFVNQSFVIICKDKNRFEYPIQISGINNYVKQDIYNIIDNYNEYGKFRISVDLIYNEYRNDYFYTVTSKGQFKI